MLSYEINENTTRTLKNLFAQSQQYWNILNTFSNSKKQDIAKNSMISNIGASTRIENAILTDVEIDWIDTEINSENHTYKDKENIIKNKLSKDKERSIEEVVGYREVLKLINNDAKSFMPLSESNIKGLHRELMKYYPEAHNYLGNYKTQINSVVETNNNTGKKRLLLKTADPGIQTETNMGDLVKWLNETLAKDPWCIPTAVEFVFRFLAIHPFQDGNGRLSRLLFQTILMNAEDSYFSDIIPYIALDRSVEITRTEYYMVLQKCSGGEFRHTPQEYNYTYLLNYMMKKLGESFSNIDFYANKFDKLQALSETDLKLLYCFRDKPEKYIQTKDLISILNIPRRTIIYSLNKLLRDEFIQSIGKGPGVKYKITF